MTLPHCLFFFLLSNDKAMIKFECEKNNGAYRTQPQYFVQNAHKNAKKSVCLVFYFLWPLPS